STIFIYTLSLHDALPILLRLKYVWLVGATILFDSALISYSSFNSFSSFRLYMTLIRGSPGNLLSILYWKTILSSSMELSQISLYGFNSPLCRRFLPSFGVNEYDSSQISNSASLTLPAIGAITVPRKSSFLKYSSSVSYLSTTLLKSPLLSGTSISVILQPILIAFTVIPLLFVRVYSLIPLSCSSCKTFILVAPFISCCSQYIKLTERKNIIETFP